MSGMGLVVVKIKLINHNDVLDAERGLRAPGMVRAVEIDAIADTGAVGLALP
jgi:hypothetical protein